MACQRALLTLGSLRQSCKQAVKRYAVHMGLDIVMHHVFAGSIASDHLMLHADVGTAWLQQLAAF